MEDKAQFARILKSLIELFADRLAVARPDVMGGAAVHLVVDRAAQQLVDDLPALLDAPQLKAQIKSTLTGLWGVWESGGSQADANALLDRTWDMWQKTEGK